MSSAAEVLLGLAAEFGWGSPLQALKCLEAALAATPPPQPLAEVRARLQAAALLSEFTDNVSLAVAHLERAVRGEGPPP